jgi:hypothetical protein
VVRSTLVPDEYGDHSVAQKPKHRTESTASSAVEDSFGKSPVAAGPLWDGSMSSVGV